MPIPWSTTCQYRMPVEAWTAMIDHYHGNSRIIRIHNDTLDDLAHYKADRGHCSFDHCVIELLAGAKNDAEAKEVSS